MADHGPGWWKEEKITTKDYFDSAAEFMEKKKQDVSQLVEVWAQYSKLILDDVCLYKKDLHENIDKNKLKLRALFKSSKYLKDMELKGDFKTMRDALLQNNQSEIDSLMEETKSLSKELDLLMSYSKKLVVPKLQIANIEFCKVS